MSGCGILVGVSIGGGGGVGRVSLENLARVSRLEKRVDLLVPGPGPAHLDTCEFEFDVAGAGRVAFCGYVDRGQRIESSQRPRRVVKIRRASEIPRAACLNIT